MAELYNNLKNKISIFYTEFQILEQYVKDLNSSDNSKLPI